MEEKRAKFLTLYANIPEEVRGDIIVVIDKEPYTWRTAYLEIKEDTILGKKILKALENIKIV